MASLLSEYFAFDRELSRITQRLGQGYSSLAPHDEKLAVIVEHAVMKLQDVWSCRVRRVILYSAAGGCRTASGRKLPRAKNLPWARSAMDRVREIWTSRTMDRIWEPKWYDPSQAIRVATLLDIANKLDVAAGLGASTAAENLRIVRNVIVHSVPDPWRKFRRLANATGTRLTPVQFVSTIDPITGLSMITDWIEDLRRCMRATVQ